MQVDEVVREIIKLLPSGILGFIASVIFSVYRAFDDVEKTLERIDRRVARISKKLRAVEDDDED